MDPIYVTGHRNPDTDSIVAAMAYAALRNAVGDREYQAACLGHVSDETHIVLQRFGFEPPTRINNMYTQVRDLEYDTPPFLNAAVTVGRAWKVLQEQKNISAVPVINEDGTLFGMLSRENVASYNMEQISLGKLLNEAGENTDMVSGEICIALPQSRESLLFNRKDSIVLCGHQPDMIRRALEMNVNCLVLCQAEISEELRQMPTTTCIISTPHDAYRAARLIFQSVPVGRICRTKDLLCFHLEDRVDEVREQVLKFREHCYPILDEKEKVAGVLTRYHLLRPRRKRVVLVDHNEASQSVPGLEEAEILEIIDHHRLADIQTTNPIYVRNEPVGSTNTIIAGMFQDRGLMPSANMAGMMAAAIISDTVMFKSPTCTAKDVRTAENKSAKDLLFTDYKDFHIAGYDLAVGQVTCVDSPKMLERKEQFLDLMYEAKEKDDLAMVILMLTDVLKEGTQLIYVGDDETIQQAFGVTPKENTLFLPGIMSRKKQVIPMLSALWG